MYLSPNFQTFKEPKSRFQGTNTVLRREERGRGRRGVTVTLSAEVREGGWTQLRRKPLPLQYSLYSWVSMKRTENNHLGRLYLGVTHATVNSTVQTLTQYKARNTFADAMTRHISCKDDFRANSLRILILFGLNVCAHMLSSNYQAPNWPPFSSWDKWFREKCGTCIFK